MPFDLDHVGSKRDARYCSICSGEYSKFCNTQDKVDLSVMFGTDRSIAAARVDKSNPPLSHLIEDRIFIQKSKNTRDLGMATCKRVNVASR